MMVHDNVQSVGDYDGMDSGKFNDDYDNMGFTRVSRLMIIGYLSIVDD